MAEEEERPVARLLDLKKTYPRMSKPALLMLLERYGLRGKLFETVMDLHETTEYKVKGWGGGVSESWIPARSSLCCIRLRFVLVLISYSEQLNKSFVCFLL